MLGKLLKYDFKSMIRDLIPIWIIAPVLGLLLGLNIGREEESQSLIGGFFHAIGIFDPSEGFFSFILAMVFFGIMMAMTVLTIVLILQRFWRGLLQDEGYLMFTLPVETWELITAKGITATIISCISGLVGLLSIVILIVGIDPENLLSLLSMWNEIWELLIENFDILILVDLILLLLVVVFGFAKSIYHIYAAMAMGQLFQSHRKMGALVSYIGIAVVVSVIGNILGVFAYSVSPEWILENLKLTDSFGTMALLSLGLIVEVAQVVIFHVITERILSKKLNLE